MPVTVHKSDGSGQVLIVVNDVLQGAQASISVEAPLRQGLTKTMACQLGCSLFLSLRYLQVCHGLPSSVCKRAVIYSCSASCLRKST